MRAGLPKDAAQWIALALGASVLTAVLVSRVKGAAVNPRKNFNAKAQRRRDAKRPRENTNKILGIFAPSRLRAFALNSRFFVVTLSALAAALLSAAYIQVYLRGGPRIIDATSYWLEARALASGHLAWTVEEPVASTIGRFLVRSQAPGPPQIAVIFPPGFPAVLALGFLAGAPLAVGPLLAAALAAATYDLAARVSSDPLVPRLAALFSVLCAALRYHTADTMSHGLAALCFTVALAFTLRALDEGARSRSALVAGLAAGWLAATRPASALALLAALLVLIAFGERWQGSRDGTRHARRLPRRALAVMALGTLPGLALLVAHQRAATGAWTSSQALYYATSDGPPGCFRYGFGEGVGCLGEHGDFVRANLAAGYGAYAATGTTLRRLWLHLVDPLNAEPLFLLVLIGAVLAFRSGRARVLALAPLLQIAAYVPFYFDGNYPGGGARFYADILPVEHVLAALAAVALAARAARVAPPIASAPPRLAPPARWIGLAAALPLLGFALRAGFDHALLRDREGGGPMFDPALLARSGVDRGLFFIDSDYGFNLGHAPGAPREVLRYRGDALDRMAWEARGRPPAFRYRVDVPERGRTSLSLSPMSFAPEDPPLLVIEGESLWPPRAQHGAWAAYEHAAGTCASAGRWLAIHATGSDPAVRLDLPAPWLGGAELSPRIGATSAGVVRLLVDGAEVRAWSVPAQAELACAWLDPHPIPRGAATIALVLAPRLAPLTASAAPRLAPLTASAAPRLAPSPSAIFALDALSIRDEKAIDR